MSLDPKVQEYLAQLDSLGLKPMHELTPSEARGQMEAGSAALGPGEHVKSVKDLNASKTGDAIPLRMYQPNDNVNLPALMYFHGGGWVIGSIKTHDNLCRTLANRTQRSVFSVDYRLAPEHRAPAAADDCFDATQWVVDHASELNVDSGRVSIAGDSAGGNLAAVVSWMARCRGSLAIESQALLYPITDCLLDTESYESCESGFMLTRKDMAWFWDHYVPNRSDRTSPQVSPLRVSDLAGLPKTLVITAEYDPLRDEAEQFAARLTAAGIDTTMTRYDGMIHGFIRRHKTFTQGEDALKEIVAFLA